jgi:hypothetical protein
MNDQPQSEPAREGRPDERSRIDYSSNRIPIPLLIAWVVLFAWIATYVALYLVPALPR